MSSMQTMLDAFDAMSLLASLIGRDVRPKSFIRFLQTYKVDSYICSERLCFTLQKHKLKNKLSIAQLDAKDGEEYTLGSSAILCSNNEMTVLTDDGFEVEFSKGTFQKVFHCSVIYYPDKFRLLSLCNPDLEGVSTIGELVRWRSPELLSDILEPVFQEADIHDAAKKIKKGATSNNKKIKLFKYQVRQSLILEAIRELGYDPKNMPPHEKGKSGIKSVVRGKLKKELIFKGEHAFDGAWAQLLKSKDIVEVKVL